MQEKLIRIRNKRLMMIQQDDNMSNGERCRCVLLVDKPAGITSADVDYKLRDHVAKLIGVPKKKLAPKVGHAGTLDPFATGALVVGIGSATKELNELKGSNKRYEATIKLGQTTDTDDYTGEVVKSASSRALKALTDEQIERALDFVLQQETQIPCVYSAKHINGVRAYHLARNARSDASAQLPEIKPIQVESQLQDFSIQRDKSGIFVHIDVVASEGAYIRAVARDLGRELNVGGHLTNLRRTAVGEYNIDKFVKLEDLLKTTTYDELAEYSQGFLMNFVATIGTFDGVHIGHQELLKQTVAVAKKTGQKSVAFIVDSECDQQLMDISARKSTIRSLGIDECAVLNMDAVENLDYQEFLDIFNDKYNITTWILTEESTIGKNAAGTITSVRDYVKPKGVDVLSVDLLTTRGYGAESVVVSSALIRRALEAGHVKGAQKLLGRFYKIRGTVVGGNKRGRELGFPTANLENIDTVIPREGVYYGVVEWIDKGRDKNIKRRAGALFSIGDKPTFDDDKFTVEVHLVTHKGSNLDLYGEQLKIAFHARVRPIRKYDDPQLLARQLFYESKIAQTAWALENGRVVVLPTDTVLGLACSYYLPRAANLICKLKGRSPSKQLQVLVATLDQAYLIGYFNENAKLFARRNWPGPFTIVVPKRNAPGETVGLRISSNRLVSDLIKFVGPLYCSSANKAGQVTPGEVSDVVKLFGKRVDAFFYKHKVYSGVPSAVIDFTGPIPKRLR
ncbi:MAG: tRNA pseudouridine(55) synthase TruB [Candidatus Ancillula trichonymphae]|nr:tRNA pseudouridine(55) synthase TruB [Candidatus Ancillula trichonymphae]